jgi:hypothetical protein
LAKIFCIFPFPIRLRRMTQPLGLVYYEKLMPGSQLVNKLQDLNYRVQTVNDPAAFHSCARDEPSLLAIVDLAGGDAVCSAIAALKTGAATGHIPVITFAAERANQAMEARKGRSGTGRQRGGHRQSSAGTAGSGAAYRVTGTG